MFTADCHYLCHLFLVACYISPSHAFCPGFLQDPFEHVPPKIEVYLNNQTFQVPKMEVLGLIRLFWGWVFPYISLTYCLYRFSYLHFRYLKCLGLPKPSFTVGKYSIHFYEGKPVFKLQGIHCEPGIGAQPNLHPIVNWWFGFLVVWIFGTPLGIVIGKIHQFESQSTGPFKPPIDHQLNDLENNLI